MIHELPASLTSPARQGPPGLRDALSIWWAGVCAAQPCELFARQVQMEDMQLRVVDSDFDLRSIRRIVVVGAGKASAGMATALYHNSLRILPSRVQVEGWINAPVGSFQAGSAGPIHLHAARPAGVNEPTEAAVAGTERILQLVQSCGANDLCLVLLSGGGSALLTAPIDGITLSDKQQVARQVAAAGANIQQLNTVRRALSRVKGGGLAAHCRARHMLTLIISDVLGDPLETIASGPTVQSAVVSPHDALGVLEELNLLRNSQLNNVVEQLRRRAAERPARARASNGNAPVSHIVLANNATAVDAAGVKAVELGYRYIMQTSRTLEGDVGDLSLKVANTIEQLGHESQVDCWISGGEPTVKLPDATQCGKGGRNQQLVLLTMLELDRRGWPLDLARFPQTVVGLSAGTDGEDGPTPAAGAWFDASMWRQLREGRFDAVDYALRADAYNLFGRLHNLIISGPTGTNVCDLRIVLKPHETSRP